MLEKSLEGGAAAVTVVAPVARFVLLYGGIGKLLTIGLPTIGIGIGLTLTFCIEAAGDMEFPSIIAAKCMGSTSSLIYSPLRSASCCNLAAWTAKLL